MDQNLYFAVFLALVAICLLAMVVWRTPKRNCPSCGSETPIQNRRCRFCSYSFGHV